MNNRPLTQKEIDLAPEWATHYYITFHDDVIFENDRFGQILFGSALQVKYECNGLRVSSTPIPRKPFDIESVEWSDASGITCVSVTGDNSGIVTTYTGIGDVYVTKQDIINKAKALGVTAEDLK